MKNRSTAAELNRRTELAAKLIAQGMPRAEIVSALAEKYSVDRRTARRYVLAGADLIAEESGPLDVLGELSASLNRLQSIAAEARRAGNLATAACAEKTISATLATVYRTDNSTVAVLHGKTFAMPDEPSERQRRKYREPSNVWP